MNHSNRTATSAEPEADNSRPAPESAGEKPHPALANRVARKSTFLSYVHHFRGIAILCILAGHSINCFTWPQRVWAILEIIVDNGTVYFMFIAGYLFQHLSARYNYTDYLKTKFQNVVLPYIIMSAPSILTYTLFIRVTDFGDYFFRKPVPLQAFLLYLKGNHLVAYWYIPVIAAYYLISPLLIYWDRDERLHWILVPLIGLSMWASRGQFWQNCIYFLPTYMMGMLCSHYRDKTFEFVSKYHVLLICLAVGSICAEWVVLGHKTFPVNLVQKLTFCALFLYWLKGRQPIGGRILSYFASISFGLYFIHPYVIALCKHGKTILTPGMVLGTESRQFFGDGNILAAVAFFVALVTLSSALASTGKRLFGRFSRMIIGC